MVLNAETGLDAQIFLPTLPLVCGMTPGKSFPLRPQFPC